MNLPNKLSLLRIFLVPIMAVLFILEIPYGALWAAIVFVVAAFTDFLDGHIARKRNLVTDLGKLLDPIADKLLVLFGLFLVVEGGLLPFGIGSISAALIIGRELLVSALRQIAVNKNIVIQANFYGKIKAVFQYISLPLLMITKLEVEIVKLSETLFDIIFYTSYVTFFIAVVLTILSGAVYVVQNRKVFYDE